MLCKIKPVLNLNDKENRTLMFAAKELQRYLKMVICEEIPVMATQKYEPSEGVLFLGTNLAVMPEVSDKVLDDAICIDVENFSGLISGTNSRSVLIAVYKFLKEKGFKFIRPGKDGEIIPKTIDGSKVSLLEKASYRHRGMCIEGGVFQEELCDVADWLPKVAMNEYFVQFRLPRTFFDRWYNSPNPYRESKALTTGEIQAIIKDFEDELDKRNIMYHAVGHGWTSEAFGMEGSSFDPTDIEPTEEQKSVMAKIDGKRELFAKTPLFTNLCYSRQDVRDSVTDNIVNYCEEHPQVKYLHFWLADATNNHCECDECRKNIPSEYYAMMLNDLDRKLTEKGIDTKIVFLLYYDLLWKPIKNKIQNQDRFTMMFAPIGRSYSCSYDANAHGEMKPFVLNNLEFPHGIGDTLEYLRDWQKDFSGDSFVFDYHFMWDHYYDFAQYKHAQILSDDIKNLESIKINGFVNCQVHRAFTPTSLGMNILAETLWNKEASFDEVCENVLKAEFGAEWEKVRDYLSALSENSHAKLIRGEDKYDDTYKAKQEESSRILKNFRPVIEDGLKSDLAINWKKLDFYNKLYSLMVEYVLKYGTDEAIKIGENIIDTAYKYEYEFKDVFDASYFVRTFNGQYNERLKMAKEQ